jgi:multiple sugar transport system permease protein
MTAAVRRRQVRWGLWASVALVVLWTMLPFLGTVWASFMTEGRLVDGLINWIDSPTLDNYRSIFGLGQASAVFGGQATAVARGFINSAIVALPVAVVGTAISVLGGYAFGRYRFPFKNTLLYLLLTTRVLPPIAVIIPYFVLFSSLGLVGTPYGLILIYLTGVVPLLTWVLMGYFGSLPVEIERAARIDGCSRLGALLHVMIPMAGPGIAAAFIIAFLMAWNELLFAIVLVGGSPAETISPALLGLSPNMPGFRTIFVMFAAASVLSTLPPLALALLFQRYITGLNIADPVTVQQE